MVMTQFGPGDQDRKTIMDEPKKKKNWLTAHELNYIGMHDSTLKVARCTGDMSRHHDQVDAGRKI